MEFMDIKKISMRGFAEVSCAPPNRKQSVLRKYRSPKSEDSVGRSNYYIKALSLIKRHHKGEFAYVAAQISKLLNQATAETIPRAKTKLMSNYWAITDYLRHFGDRKLTIRTGKRLYYIFEDLIVSAQPDLVAEENGELLLIKLNLSKKDLPGGVNATLLQVLYEAAQAKGLPIKSSGVECIQTSSGSRIVGPKRGFPARQALDEECKALLALYGSN
jgi:hypothetical protein